MLEFAGVFIFLGVAIFFGAIVEFVKMHHETKLAEAKNKQANFEDLLDIIEMVYEESPTNSSQRNYRKNYNSKNNYYKRNNYRRNNYKKKVSN